MRSTQMLSFAMVVECNYTSRTMTLAEQVGSLKRALHRVLVRRLAGSTERPLLQLSALRVIARDEARTPSELSARLLIDAPAASRLVDRLARDGLLRRAEGADRRRVHLKLTPAGRSELRLLEEALGSVDDELRRHLTPKELDTAKRLLAKLQHGLLADRPHPDRGSD
jgi:MarR family transcriptional regulator, transcriptional regulator for hemolysin